MIAYRLCTTDLAYAIREDEETCVDSEAVVLGDILVLKPGSICCADLVVLEATENLSVTTFDNRDSLLSCKVVSKTTELTRENFIFAGCTILRGKAKGVVVNISDNTLMGSLIISNQWPISSKTKTMKTK